MSKSRLSALAGYRAGFLPNPTLAMRAETALLNVTRSPGPLCPGAVDCTVMVVAALLACSGRGHGQPQDTWGSIPGLAGLDRTRKSPLGTGVFSI